MEDEPTKASQPTVPFNVHEFMHWASTIRAALIIQNWYRGYRARLKTRQRYALTIFQSIEYADEQGQLQSGRRPRVQGRRHPHHTSAAATAGSASLSRPWAAGQLPSKACLCLELALCLGWPCLPEPQSVGSIGGPKAPSGAEGIPVAALVNRLFGCAPQDDRGRQECIGIIEVPDSYSGPRLQFPLNSNSLNIMIEAFKQQQNGLPSGYNPYVFNGDFVDRGKCSIEILMILFVSFLLYGDDLCLNRGNHEDFLMNMRYGFTKEVLSKYKIHGKKILQVLEEVFAWLPLGTIIDDEILIMHGGISESTDLNLLHHIERNKMKSVLMPPVPVDKDAGTETKKNKGYMPRGVKLNGSPSDYLTKHEWEQVIDILWSDPRGKRGCYPNTSRGGGCYFGPDVTTKFLNKNRLKLLIRSHECKPEGYEVCHDGKVITVFSASNYYEEGSNRGAYVKVGFSTTLRFFQYQVTKATCLGPLHQRVNTIESSAIRILKERIVSRKTDLIHSFQLQDRTKSGKISMGQWAFSMEHVLGLNLPWRTLSSHLVLTDDDGNIDYMTCFLDTHIQKPVKEATLIETLYRYRSDLQIIFNVIDSDHSGLISMEEFHSMWKLFCSHYNLHIGDSQVDELAERMDLNKDGSIDFNEFLKAFYHKHGLHHSFSLT
ncbi:hypothetical protein QTO34_000881 [Cnephaeus nilssonii]|uniref:Serine/threonine-protein phosphatase with EF-hands n=1 Tax=Cnephaeus nilssonii TaxID=3371016 RepID=A0AA40ICG0_CNENI|nr:hypothetical protein QTO34_000881 [Eptesicus nilssonii]